MTLATSLIPSKLWTKILSGDVQNWSDPGPQATGHQSIKCPSRTALGEAETFR